MRTRNILFSLAAVAILAMQLPAANRAKAKAPPATATKTVELQELKFVPKLEAAAVPLDKLPLEHAFVAQHFGKTRFAADGKTLIIESPDLKKSQTLAWQSDCPNNSIFTSKEPVPLAENRQKELKEALFAWTRYRHGDLAAGLLRLNHDTANKWDVQLDFKKVSVSLK